VRPAVVHIETVVGTAVAAPVGVGVESTDSNPNCIHFLVGVEHLRRTDQIQEQLHWAY
jgi:hypothetical protein